MTVREELLSHIIFNLEYEIGFTECGLADKDNTPEEIDQMNALIKKYNEWIEYAKENLK